MKKCDWSVTKYIFCKLIFCLKNRALFATLKTFFNGQIYDSVVLNSPTSAQQQNRATWLNFVSLVPVWGTECCPQIFRRATTSRLSARCRPVAENSWTAVQIRTQKTKLLLVISWSWLCAQGHFRPVRIIRNSRTWVQTPHVEITFALQVTAPNYFTFIDGRA